MTIDREGGVDLDTIAEMSERISRRLDVEGFSPGPYALEVSSPGIERPLRRPEHFRRAVGRRVRVKTIAALEGARNHVGELLGADDEAILVATEGGRLRVRQADRMAACRGVRDEKGEVLWRMAGRMADGDLDGSDGEGVAISD